MQSVSILFPEPWVGTKVGVAPPVPHSCGLCPSAGHPNPGHHRAEGSQSWGALPPEQGRCLADQVGGQSAGGPVNQSLAKMFLEALL